MRASAALLIVALVFVGVWFWYYWVQPEIVIRHADALVTEGRLDQAIAAYRAALQLHSGIALAHMKLGDALIQQVTPNENYQESFDEAIAEYRKALGYARKGVTHAPKDAKCYRTLALAEYRNGNWMHALAAIEKVTALQPGNTTSDGFILSMVHWRTGDKDQARNWFNEAALLTKQNAPDDTEIRHFWTESARLLGCPDPR